jgi:hypothetical protein
MYVCVCIFKVFELYISFALCCAAVLIGLARESALVFSSIHAILAKVATVTIC